MSGLFGVGVRSPAPQPVPINPVDNAAADKARADAEAAALKDSAVRGRKQTIIAGGDSAFSEQLLRGSEKSQQRAASKTLLG